MATPEVPTQDPIGKRCKTCAGYLSVYIGKKCRHDCHFPTPATKPLDEQIREILRPVAEIGNDDVGDYLEETIPELTALIANSVLEADQQVQDVRLYIESRPANDDLSRVLMMLQRPLQIGDYSQDRRTLETISSLLNGDSNQVEVVQGYIWNKLKSLNATAKKLKQSK